MLVWLISYKIEFLKVELTHPDYAIGSGITPACIRLNRTRTGQSDLCTIDSTRRVFDPELEELKLVDESQYENKNPIAREKACIEFVPKVKHK